VLTRSAVYTIVVYAAVVF